MKKEKSATKICKYCKTEISSDAKICPNCRKKQGMGIVPKVIIAIIVLGIIGSAAGGNKDTTAPVKTDSTTTAEETTAAPIEYIAVSVTDMMDDLNKNAMNASDKYKGQYIEITGKLNVIDSNGKYISLTPEKDFAIIGVQCYIKSEEQKDKVKQMTIGDIVTLKGKCTDVGEILGFSLDIDNIE